MATGYGNQIHHWQAYVEASVTSETTTTATITCKTYWHSISWGYSYYGHGYGVIGSTTGTDSGTVVFSSGTGASVYQLLTTMTKTVDKTTSSQTITCKGVAILTGDSSGTRNGTSTATADVTVPAISYEKPNAPSSCSASRSSDTKVTVTWTNGSTTTTKPRTATLVERSTDGGSWTQVASVGSSVANYSDTGVSANHRYSYRVRAKNSAGYSSYSTSGYVYTTPAAPSRVVTEAASTTQVRVSATYSAPYATGCDVQVQWDGGDWASVGTNVSLPVTTTVSGVSVKSRVRTVRGSLASAWVESASVVTATTPLAPTVTVSPSGVVAVGTTVTVSWLPNHPDGSAQSAVQVRVTPPSGTATTTTLTTETSLAVEVDETGTWSFEVMTEGVESMGFGPYSAAVMATAHNQPVVVIESPATDGAVIDSLPLAIAWSVADDTATVSAQRVTVTAADTGAVIYAGTPANDVRSLTLAAEDVPAIANGTEYAVSVTATGGSGLSASASREFATEWAAPATPTAMVSSDPADLSVSVTVFEGEGEGDEPATASLMVTRVGADGTRWVVASGMASGDTCVDPLPPLGVGYAYEVTGVTAVGATASVTITNAVETESWTMNFGAGAGEVMTLVSNPKASYSLDQGGEAYHFADGGMGNGLPVWYGTADRDESGTISFDTVLWHDSDRLRELALTYPVGWLRDPFGHRWRAHVRPKISHGIGEVWQVSVNWDAVRWEEAW